VELANLNSLLSPGRHLTVVDSSLADLAATPSVKRRGPPIIPG
jgi:hypothetical protein